MRKTDKAGARLRCTFYHGRWCLWLPDPLRRTPALPVDAVTLADRLGIGYRAALRIAQGKRPLSGVELRWLQWAEYGAIPDPRWLRGRWYMRDGVLRSLMVPGYELGPGDLFEFALLRQQYAALSADLAECRRRLRDLENPATDGTSNVIRFPGRR